MGTHAQKHTYSHKKQQQMLQYQCKAIEAGVRIPRTYTHIHAHTQQQQMLQRIQRKAIEADMQANMAIAAASKGRSLSVDDGDVAVALAQAAVTNIQHVMNQENVQQQIVSARRDNVSNSLGVSTSCAYESGCDSGNEGISRSNSNGSLSGSSMSVIHGVGTSNSSTSASTSNVNNNNNNNNNINNSSVNVASKCAGGKEEDGAKGTMPLWQMMCSGTLGDLTLKPCEETSENSVTNVGVNKRR